MVELYGVGDCVFKSEVERPPRLVTEKIRYVQVDLVLTLDA